MEGFKVATQKTQSIPFSLIFPLDTSLCVGVIADSHTVSARAALLLVRENKPCSTFTPVMLLLRPPSCQSALWGAATHAFTVCLFSLKRVFLFTKHKDHCIR